MAISKTLAEAFERFWAAYPRRPDNPKAAARAVFERRVREGADPQAIADAAGRYARHIAERKLDAIFVPHARTWLSQRRYEDYEEAPASADPTAPSPEHPLTWLKAEIGESRWASWIEPLECSGQDPVTIIALTRFALDHVKGEWGYLLRRRYGAVAWAVKPKDARS